MAQKLPPAAEQARTYSIPYAMPRKRHNRRGRRRKTIWSKTLSSVGFNTVSMGSISIELHCFRDYEYRKIQIVLI